jgi:hypothetical protein
MASMKKLLFRVIIEIHSVGRFLVKKRGKSDAGGTKVADQEETNHRVTENTEKDTEKTKFNIPNTDFRFASFVFFLCFALCSL